MTINGLLPFGVVFVALFLLFLLMFRFPRIGFPFAFLLRFLLCFLLSALAITE